METHIEEAGGAGRDAAHFEPPVEEEQGFSYQEADVAVVQEELWQYLDCECGERLCQVEDGDTFDVLRGVVRDHLREHRQNGDRQ
jgi:hypothetical protein